MLNKELRAIFLCEFKWDRKASETGQNINRVFGQDVLRNLGTCLVDHQKLTLIENDWLKTSHWRTQLRKVNCCLSFEKKWKHGLSKN